MKPAIGSSLSAQKMFRYVEWILIVGFVFYYCLLVANDIVVLTAVQLWQLSFFYVTIAALSEIFPVHRSLWVKYVYLSLEIALVLVVKFFSGLEVETFIFVAIAKSCFLLRNKQVVMLTAMVGILYVLILVWSFPQSIQAFPYVTTDINPRNPKLIKELIIGSIISYVMFSSFMIVLCSTIIAEQKSRQRAEELTRQVESLATQLERVRIARDIHDSLGHTLTNLQVQLALAQEFRQHNIERTFKAIDTAKFLTDQCIEDVSLKLKAMHQSDFHFDRALQSLIEQLKYHPGLKVNSEINLPQLPLQVSHHLYCIIKEGLTNIQKHSNADRIYLRCQATSDRISVKLEDNGRGFDPARSYPGFGLTGIKERVQILEGKLKIYSTPGGGTKIMVVIFKKVKNITIN
ncbi:sensor histidine kinase [Pleurocapsales cyanobacterium LEGE 10410]|nr:sensor histidine kinase [Pleurocapsales cyanobacterium LEGE 10410]